MRGYRSQMTRVTIEGSRYEGGQLLMSVTFCPGKLKQEI